MAHWKIDDELRTFIPRLQPDQLEQLERNIVDSREIRDPIVIWQEEDIIIDGMNRYEIAQRHDLPFVLRRLSFPDRNAVKRWMIDNQVGRRNCSTMELAQLRTWQVERKVESGKTTTEAIEEVAEDHSVSPSTVQRDREATKEVEKSSNGKTPATRSEATKKKKARKKPVKDVKKVDAAIKDTWGKLVRLIDDREDQLGGGDAAEACRGLLGDFITRFEEWQKDLR